MDEEALQTLMEVLSQINELSGAALDALMQGAAGAAPGGEGSEPGAGAPVSEQGAPPAPEGV